MAFDTSAAHCAAALHWGDRKITARFEHMAKGQAERLMVLLTELLDDEGFSFSDLDAIAVGVGPGNFTGIRIAVSAARGLALGLGIPVISVTTFELMRGPNSVTDADPQLVSLPAFGGKHYVQLFEGGKAVRAAEQVTVSARDFPDLALPPNATVLGAQARDIWALNNKYEDPPSNTAFEREIADVSETLVRIAAAKWDAGQVDGTRPAPLYVKPPDAAPSREQPPVILP